MLVVVGLGNLGLYRLPSGFKVGARLVEGACDAVLCYAAMRCRIEATGPAPLLGVERDAGADRDRADMGVPINRRASSQGARNIVGG